LVLALNGLHVLFGGWRADHALFGGAALLLYYAGPRVRPLATWLLPLLLMLAVYDLQRYWVGPLRGRVRVAEVRNWELAWFGIRTPAGRITPAAWCQTRTCAALDLLCGAAYLTFVPAFLAFAAWWRFRAGVPEGRRILWAFLGLSLAGFAGFLVYPAAPPWYADHYGTGPAVLNAPPEAGGAARFDAWLGVHWFAGFYGRNANVFGAVPSLHVGVTFLAVFYAWRLRSLRLVATACWLLVTFASVYLNHHYIVDGVAGMAVALAAGLAVEAWAGRRPSAGAAHARLAPPAETCHESRRE
jgi:hypothetical protein